MRQEKMRSLISIASVVALFLVFGLTSHDFFSTSNILNIFRECGVTGIIAVGVAMVIITSGIDLSTGALVGLCGMVCNFLMYNFGLPAGAVALICAGVYVAAGNDRKKALPMSLGFLAGDAWAVAALWVMELLPFGGNGNLFVTLCLMGALAVLIASALPQVFFLPAWLCGWAIGLTVMGPMELKLLGTTPLQIAAAMLVGVWYVGVALDAVHRKIRR